MMVIRFRMMDVVHVKLILGTSVQVHQVFVSCCVGMESERMLKCVMMETITTTMGVLVPVYLNPGMLALVSLPMFVLNCVGMESLILVRNVMMATT